MAKKPKPKRKLRTSKSLPGTCNKHPKYQALRPPQADCAICQAIWNVTQNEMAEAYAPLKQGTPLRRQTPTGSGRSISAHSMLDRESDRQQSINRYGEAAHNEITGHGYRDGSR